MTKKKNEENVEKIVRELFEIQKQCDEDLDFDILNQAIDLIFDYDPKNDIEKFAEEMPENLKIAFREDGSIASFVVFKETKTEIYIDAIYSIPEERKKGNVKKMLVALLEQYPNHNFSILPVTKEAKNLAISLNFNDALENKENVWLLER